MNDKKKLTITPMRFIISCIICAVLGAAPFVIGSFMECDITISVVLMIVVSAPISTAAFTFINRAKDND